MPRMPLRRVAPLLALLAALLSACSSVEASPAATVNGEKISVESVQDELKIIRGNEAYRQALEQSYQAQLAGTGKGTFGSSFTAQILSLKVYYELLEQSLEERDALPTRAEIAAARRSVQQQLEGLGGKRFSTTYLDQLARQDALVSKAQEEAATGGIGEEYFEEHQDDFRQACVSHILVSTEAREEAEALRLAEEIKTQLDGGADFATLARERSDDPGSKETSGDLDCGAKGRFVPEFDEAVFEQPLNEVGDPVKTEFGYHLIVVRSRSEGTLADAGEQLGQQAFNAYLLELTCGRGTKVSVNPRYGRWDRSPCRDDLGLARVAAPTPPTTTP
jgi:parvulin-like peptidyl-prolyl isomerase